MNIKENKYSSLTTLLTSIALFIIGALLFNDPGEIIETISKIFGVVLSVVGLFRIVLYVRRKNKGLATPNLTLASAITFLIVGLLFVFLAGAFETAIRFIIGAWILLSGIHKLIAIITIGSQNKNFASMLIISIVLIFLGGYIILVQNLVASVIGLIMMIYSAIEIASYIIYKVSGGSKEQTETNNDIRETKEIPTKSKEIKDAKFEETKK